MILKILGVALTIISSSAIGFEIASAYLKEIKQCKQLISALEYVENELTYRHSPLPELFCMFSSRDSGPIGKVLVRTGEMLNEQISASVNDCMNIAITEAEGLSDKLVNVLKQLGNDLGKFDIDGQLNCISAVKVSCELLLKSISTKQTEKVRSMKTIGICAGAAVAILLI